MGKKLTALLLALVMMLSLAVSAGAVCIRTQKNLHIRSEDVDAWGEDTKEIYTSEVNYDRSIKNTQKGTEEVFDRTFKGEGIANEEIPGSEATCTQWNYAKDDFEKTVKDGITHTINTGLDMGYNIIYDTDGTKYEYGNCKFRWGDGETCTSDAIIAAGSKGVSCPSQSGGIAYQPKNGNWSFPSRDRMEADDVEWVPIAYMLSNTQRTDKALSDGELYSEFEKEDENYTVEGGTPIKGVKNLTEKELPAGAVLSKGGRSMMKGQSTSAVTPDGNTSEEEITTINYIGLGKSSDQDGIKWTPDTATKVSNSNIRSVTSEGKIETRSERFESGYDCNGYEDELMWTPTIKLDAWETYDDTHKLSQSSRTADGLHSESFITTEKIYHNGSVDTASWTNIITTRKDTFDKEFGADGVSYVSTNTSFTISTETSYQPSVQNGQEPIPQGDLRGLSEDDTKEVRVITFDGKLTKEITETYKWSYNSEAGEYEWALELDKHKEYTRDTKEEDPPNANADYPAYDWARRDLTTGTSTMTDIRAEKIVPYTCELVKISGQKATTNTDGWKDYYQCAFCGDLYEDKNGTKPITDLETWKMTDGRIPAGSKDDSLCKYLPIVLVAIEAGKVLAARAVVATAIGLTARSVTNPAAMLLRAVAVINLAQRLLTHQIIR